MVEKIHPSKFIQEILDELDMSWLELARKIDEPFEKMVEIMKQERPVDCVLARKLGKEFGQSEEYWVNLQKAYTGRDVTYSSGNVFADLDLPDADRLFKESFEKFIDSSGAEWFPLKSDRENSK